MVEFELHFFEPGCYVWAVGEGPHVDFPPFGVAVGGGVGVGGVGEDVGCVAYYEVSCDLGVFDALC